MRIIAGIAKGMPLFVPRGGVRPTSDRVREAIFSSLGERVVGADVLDLFAGTGALGLEAASRGARSVTFVEKSRQALGAIAKNIATFEKNREIVCRLSVVEGDAFARLKRIAEAGQTFGLIFADPPYRDDAQSVLGAVEHRGLLAKGGLMLLETSKRDELSVGPSWSLARDAVYGDTRVRFLGRS